jgi:DNA replication and repair protein RecF
VYLEHLSVSNFRNYVAAELQPAPQGVTLLQGDNGAGKTNLLEAVGYFATLRSFRGAPTTSLVRSGTEQAVLRARANRQGRALLIEAEVNVSGRDKVQLNRQPLRRHDELLGAVLVTVFSPDDIEVVKGAPQSRRQYLDEILVALHPKHNAAHVELERVLKQRNALLRSAAGTLRGSMASTLDVWDSKLADVGEAIADARESLVVSLQDESDQAYLKLSAAPGANGGVVGLRYERSWEGSLMTALGGARNEDVRRGVTSVGPQRDDLFLSIEGLAARTQASQGEQRSLALALRLGGHSLVTARQSSSPLLLLDDVFSELDPHRSAALAACLPEGQTLLTSAGPVPEGLPVAQHALVRDGTLYPAPGAPSR